MTTSLDTRGKAAREDMLICAKCRKCGKEASVLAKDAAAIYGWNMDPKTVPFRCTAFDTRDVEISYTWREMVDKKTRVWHPVEIE